MVRSTLLDFVNSKFLGRANLAPDRVQHLSQPRNYYAWCFFILCVIDLNLLHTKFYSYDEECAVLFLAYMVPCGSRILSFKGQIGNVKILFFFNQIIFIYIIE